MGTKSFTSSSVKIFNNHQSLEYTTFYVYNKNKTFYQIKVITMMKNYDQSVEVNHNLN